MPTLASKELFDLNIVDEIIKEPLGGAHRDREKTLENIRKSIDENLNKFENFSSEEIVSQRKNKFLQIGRDKGFTHKPEMDSGLSIKNKNFYDWIKNIFYNKIYISGVIIFLLLIIGLIYFL